MAILAIEKSKETIAKSNEREKEIKSLIFDLEVDFEALVQIEGKIGDWRKSFSYYLMKCNEDLEVKKQFSILKTSKPGVWCVKRKK